MSINVALIFLNFEILLEDLLKIRIDLLLVISFFLINYVASYLALMPVSKWEY